jgi:hypothetical protein
MLHRIDGALEVAAAGRRYQYEQNKDRINAQKRAAYAARKEREEA